LRSLFSLDVTHVESKRNELRERSRERKTSQKNKNENREESKHSTKVNFAAIDTKSIKQYRETE
jgi:hypothetical protein